MQTNEFSRVRLVAMAALVALAGVLALGAPGSASRLAEVGSIAVTGWPQVRSEELPGVAATTAAGKPAVPQKQSESPAVEAPAPPPAAPARDLSIYRGLGAWVDGYDFGKPGTLDPATIVRELAARGVRTIYLQTGRWNLPVDVVDPGSMNVFLEVAHAHNMKVVGWYLPGFADNDMEIRRSLAVLNYTTPTGHKFDGFAPDIEDSRAVGKDSARFHGGIADYSRRLREAVGPNYPLAAIVVDAKNNKRAPTTWAGFPWPEIGAYYDVIMPMAYWTVTKQSNCGHQMDVASYMREVVQTTESHMGRKHTFHLIGGISDCHTVEEVAAFVNTSLELGVIGGSVYDFWTTHNNPARDQFWSQLSRFNSVLPLSFTRD